MFEYSNLVSFLLSLRRISTHLSDNLPFRDIAVSGVQLHFVKGFDKSGPFLTTSLWPWMMCGQTLQTVTVISTCVPFLREFLESFPSGGFKLSGTEGSGLLNGSRSTRMDSRSTGQTRSAELCSVHRSDGDLFTA